MRFSEARAAELEGAAAEKDAETDEQEGRGEALDLLAAGEVRGKVTVRV